MRLLRLVALVGSLILLVATIASLVNKRAELYNEQDARVIAAADGAASSVGATVFRATAVADAASAMSTPTEVLSSFGDSSAACVEADSRTCSDADLAALEAFGRAAAASGDRDGAAVAVVDTASESVLVVARRDVTVVIQLPLATIVGSGGVADFGDDVMVEVVAGTRVDGVDDVVVVDGRRVADVVVTEPFVEGGVSVTASGPSGVAVGADAPGRYGTLLAVGTVLLAFAGWTFLVERRQLERRATTDELTGLVNRREFERQSEEAIEMAGRFGTGLCIMLIDLNGFKQINDTLGHQFGDMVLKACAERLTEAVRDTDLVGRWGGDEFVVLLPAMEDSSAVRASAERINATMSATPAAGDVTITGSIGAALFPRHGRALEDLMQAADVAMYEAKSTGVVHRLAEAIPTGAPLPPPDYVGPERRKVGAPADDADRAINH